ncbi:MAG: heavy metal-associated domain-containing protein [Planctomycetota bacterium]|jgi:copper chaperone CopZ|nr:heavy metal-associated domain-containing protein [Planctomycetota bacterium]MDP6762661.1 heavy metal-associated domain-containing protein [Planctomycetota bacterium]MDP6989970.1 heavy metal-associated domain-containing protein [Planctomycetota bacterium]
MRIVLPFLVAAAGVWLGYIALQADEPDYTPPAVAVPARIETEVAAGSALRAFDVEGMCCSSCPRKLYRALMAVEGVSEAAIDFEGETAWALAPADLPVERLIEALESEKYSAALREE